MEKDLRGFVERQRERGEVLAVPEAVAARYGAARRIHDGGEATLLFENVDGAQRRAVANILSSRKKAADALGAQPRELAATIGRAVAAPRGIAVVPDAPFLATVVEKPDLGALLPAFTFYPKGERRYLTSTIVAARRADGTVNLSFHRMMLLGGNRLAVRVVPRHLFAILADAGGYAPAAAFMGVHPAVELAAATSAAPGVQELEVAAALMGGGLVCHAVDGTPVPAHAEVVLAGRFTGETVEEGPFVDVTGTWDDVRMQPVFEVDRLMARPDFLYRTILPGGAEHRLLMGLPQEARMLGLVAASVPTVRAVVLSEGGCGWLHAVVAIRPRAAGEGKTAGLAALAAHPSLKRVVVVDDDIDPADPRAVEWALATRFQADRDLVVVAGARGSTLDPSRDQADETGAKLLMDATVPHDRDRAAFARAEPPPEE